VDGRTGRRFRDQHAWCWTVAPTIAVTGEIYDEIQLDGTYLSDGWCLLVAIEFEAVYTHQTMALAA